MTVSLLALALALQNTEESCLIPLGGPPMTVLEDMEVDLPHQGMR